MEDRPTLPHVSSNLVGLKRDPLVDGRQSERALEIQRGVCRSLLALGMSPFPEFTLANGRRADVAAISEKGDIWIVEIKSSLADYRADSKWGDYCEYCDKFLFAVASEFPSEVLPDNVGYMIADRFSAEVVRDTVEQRLTAARRKAVTLRFALQTARRMQGMIDPGPVL